MSQVEIPTLQHLYAEVAHLKEELQSRDQLVQQLSQELFRLVKNKGDQPIEQMTHDRDLAEMRALREQMQTMATQVNFYQEQISGKDTEISGLKQSVQSLSDKSERLEQVVQELPNVYRQKFEERMAPVKEKVAQIQRENRKLHAELQSVSYRLAIRNRQTGSLDLPAFTQDEAAQNNFAQNSAALPSFTSAG